MADKNMTNVSRGKMSSLMHSRIAIRLVPVLAALFVAVSASPAFAADCDTDRQECIDAKDTANTACNSQDMQAGMTAAQIAQAQTLTAQANAANQSVSTTGSSAAAQCKNQAALSGILSSLSAIKAGACTSSASTCTDVCESVAVSCDQKALAIPAKAAEYKANASAARGKKKTCDVYSNNGTLAMAQAAAMMAAMFMNNSCADAASAATPTPVDCTNPTYAAVTQACICAPSGTNPYADPQNSLCTSGAATGSAATTSGLGAITPVSTDTSTDGTATSPAFSGTKEGGTQAMTGGGGGGGTGGGSGAGGGTPGAGGGAEGSSIDKTVIQGQSGGGGGGGLAVGSSGGGGEKAGGGRAGSDGKIDLSQWLPKGKYKALNIGGMSIKADDGITGPMGPSLWEKVSNQYQQQKTSLIPDR